MQEAKQQDTDKRVHSEKWKFLPQLFSQLPRSNWWQGDRIFSVHPSIKPVHEHMFPLANGSTLYKLFCPWLLILHFYVYPTDLFFSVHTERPQSFPLLHNVLLLFLPWVVSSHSPSISIKWFSNFCCDSSAALNVLIQISFFAYICLHL